MSSIPNETLENVELNTESDIRVGSPRESANDERSKTETEVSVKRLAANRRNALRSTGPKTTVGKARSSRNALKHGMLSDSPLIKGVESQEAWEQHRDAILESCAPVGYLETFFAMRIATESWRLGRSVRYEAQLAQRAVSAAESDLSSRTQQDPSKIRQVIENESKIAELLATLTTLDVDLALDKDVATWCLWAFREEVPDGPEEIFVPGVPRTDAEFDDFDKWTAGLLQRAAKVHALAAQMSPDQLREKCIGRALERRDKALDDERSWNLNVDRERTRRLMLDPRMLDTLTRYETGCERSLFKNHHALERLQAERSGQFVPPPEAIELDVTVQVSDQQPGKHLEEIVIGPSTQDLRSEEALNLDGESKEKSPTQKQEEPELVCQKCETNPPSCRAYSNEVQEIQIKDCETKPYGFSGFAVDLHLGTNHSGAEIASTCCNTNEKTDLGIHPPHTLT